jgi:hypothetical protein
MASDIDIAIPPFGNATTAGVRANFTAAKSEIEALQNSHGFVDYNDAATGTTPISVTANTWTKLTNDKLGANTKIDMLPVGVTRIWDSSTNQFKFDELLINSTLDNRYDLQVTTTGANQIVDLSLFAAIGSPIAFELPIMTSALFKTAGTYKINVFNGMYIGSNDVKNYPAEIKLRSDANCTVRVNGWYSRIVIPT